jgi:hypothetical protein
MICSKKLKALFLAGVLATLIAIPAFADSRLQGTWVLDGPKPSKAIIFCDTNFVIIDYEGPADVVGNFTVSGNNITLKYTHIRYVDGDRWVAAMDPGEPLSADRMPFSFRANNILVLGNEVYRRM